DLWKIIRKEQEFIHPQVDAHRRETLCLQDFWKGISKNGGTSLSRKEALGMKSVRLCSVWMLLFDSWRVEIIKLATYLIRLRSVRTTAQSEKERMQEGDYQHKQSFACAVCGKSLSRTWGLQSHELTHTGGKPFACEICGKSLSLTGVLFVATRFVEKGFKALRDVAITKRSTRKEISPFVLK
ncbi:unnamed protein product, partial [Cyprideis torosa]